MSAVRELVEVGRNAKYIYEFDFKQFFPKVNVDWVSHMLERDSGMPWRLRLWLAYINSAQPILPEDLKLESDKVLKEENAHFALKPMGLFKHLDVITPEVVKPSKEFLKDSILGLPQGLNTSPIFAIYSISD